MELEKALIIANKYKSILEPWCFKIEIAGSIRRKIPEVRDIEIVCIPKERQLARGVQRNMDFILYLYNLKPFYGSPAGRNCRIKLPEDIVLDLFMCHYHNWGYIYAIRTGSANYSRFILANGWCKKGLHGKDGELYDNSGLPLFVPDEDTLYKLIDIPWTCPHDRELLL